MIKAAERSTIASTGSVTAMRSGAAVDEGLLAHYADIGAFRVSVYDARRLLPQSRVTFQVRPRDGSFLINGAIGLDYVTITYLRNPAGATRAVQEAILARLM